MNPVLAEGTDPAFADMPTYKKLAFTPPSNEVVQRWLADWSKSW